MYCECGCGGITTFYRKKYQRFMVGHNLKPYKGENHGNWKGGRTMHTNDYVLIRSLNHPFRDAHGYYPLHRLVKEEQLTNLNGIRTLIHPSLDIDHKDNNKLNNAAENLQIISHSEHARIHYYGRKFNEHGRFLRSDE